MATPTFQFTSSAYPADTFTVVDFEGTDALSSLYRFDIGLKAEASVDIDLETLLNRTATLTLKSGQTNSYSGMLAKVEQLQDAGGYNYYRVALVPPVWRLSLNVRSSGFTDMTYPGIVSTVLINAGLNCSATASANPDVLTADVTGTDYPARDFTCQYAESDLDFICRLMEYEGIYFYFTDNSGICLMSLSDGASYPNAVAVPFTDPSSTNNYDSITQITRTLEQATVQVGVTGYDYQNVTTSVQGDYGVQVDNNILSGSYPATWLYDHRTPDADDAARVAQVRAQEISCWACAYSGSGALPGLRAGSVFNLTSHPATGFNREFLVTSVTHTARNADQSWATESYTAAQTDTTRAYYSNSFTLMPVVPGQAVVKISSSVSNMQFRPQRRVQKPSISGVLSGKVCPLQDTSQSSQSSQVSAAVTLATAVINLQGAPIPDYQGSSSTASIPNENHFVLPAPPMDEQGRYKVMLPFVDGTVTDGSPISAWIRMAQASAGIWTSVQYTLEPGAEVLLAFINGDPDLPVIVGSVYNGVIPAPLTSTQTDPLI
ncbi:MAG TPA: type VI secretion system tip protein TssI/VgrG [Gammaproteobacteria bacterium]|jgi:type VI secretion system secreted protein VgrG